MVDVLGLIGFLAASAPETTLKDNSTIPEENYAFLSVADGSCIPQIGVKPTPQQESECKRMAEPRRYRGTWYVGFETSVFTPAGKPTCIEGVDVSNCADLWLLGGSLPWPSRWACDRKFEVEFIGRRNRSPGLYGNAFAYKVVVERLITAKRLPDPPFDPDNCDPKAP
jgi:hypothetical protein